MDSRRVRAAIDADEIVIGDGVVIEPGTTISGPHGPARLVVLGDQVYIGGSGHIRVPELVVGDYVQVHNHVLINGYEPVHIGHNSWIGQNCILNATDRLTLGNNCGVGAYSQLWTHIRYGDVLQGCRFDSTAPLTAEDDVWFVGHCIVSPILAKSRSMAMVGSVVTRDMEANHVYAGTPATDVTHRMGPQFVPVEGETKARVLGGRIDQFLTEHPSVRPDAFGISVDGVIVRAGSTVFDVVTRSYSKKSTDDEVLLMKFLLPTAKFTPAED